MTQQGPLHYVAPVQVSAELRASVLARGDPRATATLLATRQLPGLLQEQARSPYQHSSTPSGPTQAGAADDAAREFAQAITRSGTTPQQLWKLLSTSGSPGPQSFAFDPALNTAFGVWLDRMPESRVTEDPEGLWFAAAVAQMHIAKAAGDDKQLAALLSGPEATEPEFLRCVRSHCATGFVLHGWYTCLTCACVSHLTGASACHSDQ
jgi:hypothetical protein